MKDLDLLMVIFETKDSEPDFRVIGQTLPNESTPIGTLYLGGRKEEMEEDIKSLIQRGVEKTKIADWITDVLVWQPSAVFADDDIDKLMTRYHNISCTYYDGNEDQRKRSGKLLDSIKEQIHRRVEQWIEVVVVD